MRTLTLALSLLGLASIAMAARDADIVTSLPKTGPLPSKWYSGYLNVDANKALFYVLVES